MIEPRALVGRLVLGEAVAAAVHVIARWVGRRPRMRRRRRRGAQRRRRRRGWRRRGRWWVWPQQLFEAGRELGGGLLLQRAPPVGPIPVILVFSLRVGRGRRILRVRVDHIGVVAHERHKIVRRHGGQCVVAVRRRIPLGRAARPPRTDSLRVQPVTGGRPTLRPRPGARGPPSRS